VVLAIFDHDGVLVDSLALHEESWLEMAQREGIPLSWAYIRETFGMTNAAILRRLLGDAVSAGQIQHLSDVKEVCYRELAHGRLELMAGVRELIEALSAAGVRLAIGSSGPRKNLDLTVETCGLGGRFATIVSAEDVRHGKPDPEVFLQAARRLGVEPAVCVVFEDAPVGIQAALAAGMRAVGVGSTHGVPSLETAGAHEVVSTLAGYPAERLIERLRGGPAASEAAR
jgi:beta-phosphoglucomutase family hydrolase